MPSPSPHTPSAAPLIEPPGSADRSAPVAAEVEAKPCASSAITPQPASIDPDRNTPISLDALWQRVRERLAESPRLAAMFGQAQLVHLDPAAALATLALPEAIAEFAQRSADELASIFRAELGRSINVKLTTRTADSAADAGANADRSDGPPERSSTGAGTGPTQSQEAALEHPLVRKAIELFGERGPGGERSPERRP